jgi:Protein of unknown function (DUF2799)
LPVVQRSILILAPLLAFLAAGCALFPLSEAECKGVNWERRGYADGYGGHPQQYSRLSSECKSRFGVEVPEAEYFKGWRDGYNEWDRLWGSMDKRR